MDKAKTIIAGALCLPALILIVQNVETVETRILFYTLSLPRAFLLFGAFIVGFVAGSLWTTNKISNRNEHNR